jgi:hypothetical protein
MTARLHMSVASLHKKAAQYRAKAARDATAEKREAERLARLEKFKDIVDQINADLIKGRP